MILVILLGRLEPLFFLHFRRPRLSGFSTLGAEFWPQAPAVGIGLVGARAQLADQVIGVVVILRLIEKRPRGGV